MEYARETGDVYEVRYMCLRHATWALELDSKAVTIRVTTIEESNLNRGGERKCNSARCQ